MKIRYLLERDSDMTLSYDVFTTPLGDVFAAVDAEGAVMRLTFLGRGAEAREAEAIVAELEQRGEQVARRPRSCADVRGQVRDYLAGRRDDFDLAIAPTGTDFQHDVWDALCRIPRGETVSYAELARRVGRPGAFRAVGRANATNPIALVVPCHRVIGGNGALTGFAGGIPIKRALLELEGAEAVAGC